MCLGKSLMAVSFWGGTAYEPRPNRFWEPLLISEEIRALPMDRGESIGIGLAPGEC